MPSLFGLQYVFFSCLRKIRRIRNNEQGVEKKVILEGVGEAHYYRTIRTNPLNALSSVRERPCFTSISSQDPA